MSAQTKILIADDNEDARLILQTMLEAAGYGIETAVDGLQALQRARRAPPDLIIADILMPRMDGFELCRRIKRDPRLHTIPFVFYTATYTSADDQALALQTGASRFIAKPAEPKAFLEQIAAVLRDYRLGTLTVPDHPALDNDQLKQRHKQALMRKLQEKIAELEQEKRALHESEARYRSLIEQASDGIFVFDAAGELLDVNGAGLQLTGYRRSELLELNVRTLIAPEDLLAKPLRLDALVSGQRALSERLIRRKDGGRVAVEISAKAHHDGRIQAIVRDITERKRDEQNLRQLNRVYAVLSACNEALVRAEQEQALLDTFCRKIVDTGAYRMAWVGLAEPGPKPALRPAAWAGHDNGFLDESIGKQPGMAPFSTPLRTLSAAVVQSIHADPHAAEWRAAALQRGYGSCIALPLVHSSSALGTLNIFAARADAFDEQEIGLLKELADDLAFGINSLRSGVARRQVEETLHLRNRAIQASSNGIIICDARQHGHPIVYVNAAFSRITGYDEAETLGRNPAFLTGVDRNQLALEPIRAALREGSEATAVLRSYRKDGTPFWNELSVAPVRNEAGVVTHHIGIINDISERINYEHELEHRSNHDELTGLANRNLLQDRLQQALQHAERNDSLVAVLFLDIDRFKQLNDSFGHETADQVLQQLGKRLTGCVRQGDTVARRGGDEFILILTELHRRQDVQRLIESLLDTVTKPIFVQDHEIVVTGSIGAALYPQDGDRRETLLRHADIAMYRAKEAGRNTYRFFAAEMDVHAKERLRLEAYLRHALDYEELRLHFQPQVELQSGRIVGMEALLRWQHPIHGLIPPAQFVPLAEESGLIVSIGDWVLQAACAQNMRWQAEGLAPLRIAVNISALQCLRGQLAASAVRALEASAMRPELLELELTESMLIGSAEDIVRELGQLSDRGVQFSIDDFGTGYSSLAYLKRFPAARIKIDRSFVHDIITDADDAAIATTIIAMAHNLQRRVVAEGVENREQLDYLRAHQCDEIQGFLFSPPLPAAEVTDLLRRHASAPAVLR